MYPQIELNALLARKHAVRRRIEMHRDTCAEQFIRVARPLAWLDQARARWGRVSPVAKAAAIPLGFLLKKTLFPKFKSLGFLLKWAPLAVTLFRTSRGR